MYIYGILNSNASLHLSIPKDLLLDPSLIGMSKVYPLGLEESEPRPCPAPASRGGACAQERDKSNGVVYTIPYQDISALVRDSEIVDGSTTLTINPERAKSLDCARDGSRDGEQVEPRVERVDTSTPLSINPERAKRVERVDYTHMRKDILARLLVGHQTVIEKIMIAQTTIIPMRLGTHALDEAEVRDILSKGYNLIKKIFEKTSDKIEIDIVASWSDFNSIIKEAGEEKEIRELKEKLLSNPKGINVDDQMKIGFMLKKELDKKRDNYACQIQEALKTVSPDFKVHELMDDKMVFNTAFLIDKDKRVDFDKKVEELNAEFNEKLNFRCVGPLPPYSFYTLEIKKLQFEEIDWARKKLCLLNDTVTKDEIKKAHQALAFSSHPDKNPNTPGIEKEFDEVSKAYNVLWEYCQKEPCSFKEDEFEKNAILVRLRG